MLFLSPLFLSFLRTLLMVTACRRVKFTIIETYQSWHLQNTEDEMHMDCVSKLNVWRSSWSWGPWSKTCTCYFVNHLSTEMHSYSICATSSFVDDIYTYCRWDWWYYVLETLGYRKYSEQCMLKSWKEGQLHWSCHFCNTTGYPYGLGSRVLNTSCTPWTPFRNCETFTGIDGL
jgi:hypothetical protein